ncbi:BRO-N domain-containing protein [Symbiopectobacterium sp. Eva_TO]
MSILARAVTECTPKNANINFTFEDYQIRTIMKDGNLWFVASDVCRAVELDNTSIRKLDDDEKDLHSMQTPGGMQDISVISESGLYTLILRCRDAVKQGTLPWRFRKWVTNEVLPTIRKTGSYERNSVVEPLSPNDMSNLTRLVWLMTKGMKFERAWNAGVWHCLRSVTGRPSPEPFSVDDLPALGEECRRLLKVTSRFNSVVYDFEKEVIRSVVRRRGNMESMIEKMKGQMLEFQDNERDGMLALDKLCESGVKDLLYRQ